MAKVRRYRDDVSQQVSEALWEAAVVVKVRKKDLLKWPDDVEMLHQYRISIRVSRSLVKFLAPYLRKAQARELKARLKELQDPTSRLRELDVLVPLLADTPDIQEACRAEQARVRKEFIAGMKLPETADSLAFVQGALKNPDWKGIVRRRGISQAELALRVDELRQGCEDTLDTVDFFDQDAVHTLRKQAKALRYVSRELDAALPEGAAKTSGRMREVQDLLGEWCDARVNAALVTEICGDAGAELASGFQSQADAIVRSLRDSRPELPA